MTCDICSNSDHSPPSGFILTTKQVVETKEYWMYTLRNQWRNISDIVLEGMIQIQASSPDNWAVCPSCIGMFECDRKEAKRKAEHLETQKGAELANLRKVLSIAREAASEIKKEQQSKR